MKNNTTKEIIVSLSLIALAILLLNPFHFWMPDIMVMCILVIVLALFGIFSSFILRERVFDERDNVHRALSGRNSFLAGSAILILAIVIQEYNEALDPWLVIVLIVMIITKIATRFWSDRNF